MMFIDLGFFLDPRFSLLIWDFCLHYNGFIIHDNNFFFFSVFMLSLLWKQVVWNSSQNFYNVFLIIYTYCSKLQRLRIFIRNPISFSISKLYICCHGGFALLTEL